MKLLILCPGKIAPTVEKICCFTDVLNYYLPRSLSELCDATVMSIPDRDGEQLQKLFESLPVDGYDAILTLGLRFYSKIPPETTALLRSRFGGLFCQVHDGSRQDYDPVDVTFTFKDDTSRMEKNSVWLERHVKYNEYMGWATDPDINRPLQDPRDLRILVDHTNYGNNEVDHTVQILQQIEKFIKSKQWKKKFDSVTVRRFDSGRVVDVDFKHLDTIQRYDRTPIPFTEITQEHCKAHLFFVTHPESVGLVVLETAMAGALPVVPYNFVPADRLKTVRHVVYNDKINWLQVLLKIDVQKSREVALNNTWTAMAERIVAALTRRLEQRTQS